MPAYVVVRLKGHRRIRAPVRDTLASLRLTRTNHAVILPVTAQVAGQLQHAKDYITFGTVEAPQIAALIRARGRLEGDRPVTDAVVAEGTKKYRSIDEFAAALAGGEARYADLAGVKPLFRLAPPKGGLPGGIKRSVPAHGNLGARGTGMAALLARMM